MRKSPGRGRRSANGFPLVITEMGHAYGKASRDSARDPVFGDRIVYGEAIRKVRARVVRGGGGAEELSGYVANRTLGLLMFRVLAENGSWFVLGNPAERITEMPEGSTLYLAERGA